MYPGVYYGPIDFKRKNLIIGSLFIVESDQSYIDETIIMGSNANISPFVQINGISEPEVELNGFTFQDISLNVLDEGMQSYVLINIINASPKIINNRFDNFVIYGKGESGVIFCKNSNSLIKNNIFNEGNIGLNYELTGWILSKNSNLTIEDNIMKNGYVGFSDPTGYIVSVSSNNIISGNMFNNVSMGYCWTCAAIVALDGSSVIINNNLILGATGDGYGAILASGSEYNAYNNTLVANRGGYTNFYSDGVVNNDIIYPNGWGNSITLDSYSSIQISYSNIEGGFEGIGNIDENPMFSDPDNDDYSLQAGSPCIDTGTADLDGDSLSDINNYYGLYPDMGAFEYEYSIVVGDINMDGNVDVLDVIILVNHILSPATVVLEGADINDDDQVNILDVVQLVNIILGIIDNTIFDIDGNIYETIWIGGQLWMAENLKVIHYNNGDDIIYITSEEQWGSFDEGQYTVYDDGFTNADIYGNLYNWLAVVDSRGICPEGWHVPTDEEFTVLTNFLGGESIAGGKLKEAGLEHWDFYSDQISLEATNESGFTGLPAGYKNTNNGESIAMGSYGYFWSSTEMGSDLAWRRYLFHYSSGVGRDTFGKPNGFSIRCVKD